MQIDPTETVSQINRLLSAFPGATNAEPDEVLARYIEAVVHLPTADVEAAVTQYIRAEVPGQNPRFAPTAPELAAVARRHMEHRLDLENSRKNAVLQITARDADAEKTDESRARVAQMVQSVTAKLGEAMLTDEAKAEHRRRMMAEKANARFPAPSAERLMRRHRGYTVGNDGEGFAE